MGVVLLVDPDTLLKRLYEWGLSFGESRAGIRAKLGAPSSVATSASSNPYMPTTDTVTLMNYPDLQFIIVRAGVDGRELLTDVSVTGNRVSLPIGVRFGATTQGRIVQLLGQAKNRQRFGDTTVVGFAVPNSETGEVIQFCFLTNTLRKIRWVFYID